MKKIIILVIFIAFVCGCTSTQMTTKEIKKGMTKDKVAEIWGEPKSIKNWRNTCCREEGEETWYYYASHYQPKRVKKCVVFDDQQVEYVFLWK